MSGWNKTSAIEWFTRHAAKAVVVRQVGTPVRVRGIVRAIAELDACSADFVSASIETGLSGVQVEVSFHDDGLSVHLLARTPSGATHEVSLAASVPYARLELAEAASSASLEQRDGEPPRADYPYELIR